MDWRAYLGATIGSVVGLAGCVERTVGDQVGNSLSPFPTIQTTADPFPAAYDAAICVEAASQFATSAPALLRVENTNTANSDHEVSFTASHHSRPTMGRFPPQSTR